jgi:hypothetical protein
MCRYRIYHICEKLLHNICAISYLAMHVIIMNLLELNIFSFDILLLFITKLP